MDIHELKSILTESLFQFSKNERAILEQDAHEEAITSSLLKYLENGFHDFPFNIHSQYDKRIIDDELVKKKITFLTERIPKSLLSKKVLADSGLTINKCVRPDFILHDISSSKHNFLVIEIKKSTNKKKDEKDFDFLKLEVFTKDDLHYDYGVFVEFNTGNEYDVNNPFFFYLYCDGQRVDSFNI